MKSTNPHIGYILKKIRLNKSVTQQQLAEYCNCSKDNISKIERGIHKPAQDLLHSFSLFLKFDFITLNKKISNFKNYEHYLLTHEMIAFVDSKNLKGIEEILKKPVIQNDEFNYGEPLIVKDYCTSLVLFHIDKDYDKLLSLALKILNIDSFEDIETFVPEPQQHNYYYAIALSLGGVLNHQKNFKLLLTFQNNCLSFLENMYFNNIIPFSSIDLYYKKLYITVLNNYADTLYNLQNYEMSLEVCNKAINYSNTLYISNVILQLLKLKTFNLFHLNRLEDCKEYFAHFKSFCTINDNLDYFNDSIKGFENIVKLFD